MFQKQNFNYQLYKHEAAFTVGEAQHLQQLIPGAHTKNLFLKDKKGNYFVVSVLDHKRVNIKLLSKSFGRGGLSFANEEDLMKKLNLSPGSVTPYGLIHDKQTEVKLLLDQDFLNYDFVNFHPLRNDMTVSMPLQSFLEFLDIIEHPPIIIEIPVIS